MFVHDLRYGLRALRKSPGFAATAVLILSVAIGASTAIFSVFDAFVLHPLPYRNPERLVRITEDYKQFDITAMQLSDLELDDLRGMTRSFSHIAGIRSGDFTLTGGGAGEAVPGLRVSASIFPMLNVTPVLGSAFRIENEEYGRHRVVVLSERLWRRRFGADPNIAGRSIEINRERYTVAAVSRPILEYLGTAWDLWVPLSIPPADKAPASRNAKGVDVVARLAPGVTLSAAEQDLAAVTARLSAQHPGFYPATAGFSFQVAPLVSVVAGDLRQPLLFLLAAVGVLMLIACANVSNLLMARAAVRRREMSIRAALGASRARVVAQLMGESVTLAGVAGAFGVALAAVLVRLFELYGPAGMVPVADVEINAWVVAFAIGASSVASLLFGLAPALATSAGANDPLKQSGRGVAAAGSRFRESMIALQVAASLVLLVCAGLLIQSFLRLQRADPGFDPVNVLTFDLQLPAAQYGEPAQRAALYEGFQARLQAIPGVVSAGAVDRLPFGGLQGGSNLAVVGRVDPAAAQPMVRPSRILPGYLESLGIPLRRGRSFTAADTAVSAPVALIDDATARRFFSGSDDPIGRQITAAGVTSTVVGVVGTVKRRDLAAAPDMGIYHPAAQRAGRAMTFTVKTTVDPLAALPAMRAALREIDPLLPLTRAVTMEQRLSDSLARRRLAMQLIVFFGGAALLLAAIGLYGVLAYVVSQRRREVGIRVALGARPAQVMRLVVARQGVVPVVLGLATGLAAAVAVSRLLASRLFEVSPADPAVYVGVTALLSVTAIAAMVVPARRAATVDPVVALSEE